MAGLSLQDFAKKLQNRVTRQALHKYEKGGVKKISGDHHIFCKFNVRRLAIRFPAGGYGLLRDQACHQSDRG